MFGLFKKRKVLKCDSCGVSIKPAQIKILERAAGTYKGSEVTMTYFQCGKCSREYPITYTTPEIRERIAKLKERGDEIGIHINRGKWAGGKSGKLKEARKAEKAYQKWQAEYNALNRLQDTIKTHFRSEAK